MQLRTRLLVCGAGLQLVLLSAAVVRAGLILDRALLAEHDRGVLAASKESDCSTAPRPPSAVERQLEQARSAISPLWRAATNSHAAAPNLESMSCLTYRRASSSDPTSAASSLANCTAPMLWAGTTPTNPTLDAIGHSSIRYLAPR